MSETKYRVWQTNVGDYDKTTKKFTLRPRYFYGEDVIINGNGQLLSVESGWDIQGVEQPTDYVLEKSTGMQDENGNEIWEGDIVSAYNGDVIGKITQHESGEWWIEWIGKFGGSSPLYGNCHTCKVVSSINENPELLEGEK